MRISNLEIYCQVIEEESISKVARKNFITQPAVTKQIRQLENVYGTTLFKRDKGSLVPTKGGRQLYKIFKRIVFEYNQSFTVIDELIGEEDSSLKLGSSFTIGEYLLPAILGDFKKIYPDVDINLEVGSTPRVLQSLQENEIGIALVEGAVEEGDYFKVKKFAEDELILVCSPDHALANTKHAINVEDLIGRKLIGREKNSGTRMFIEQIFKTHGVPEDITVYMEFGSTQAIKGAVEANLGIAILSEIVVRTELKNGSLVKVPIKDLTFNRDLWIVQRKDRFIHAIEKKFIDFLFSKQL
ncbi:DNA-binding transcriptional regulator, LysR family [Lentibacillus persicus]|uniref:DNA-binding transcriptional regulator, LysR family n=1 Tax=Lentibacillus persicus TaxID=640948 RepID=A0A1I1VX60_9BACI|nr:LysR family transcriptional regulator [Lentibacillus persicus]SFD87686.1 DNA-binding transcriptional regulator, LysR family [Lentibacillus persicus]